MRKGPVFSPVLKGQFLIYLSHRKGYVSLENYTSFLIDKESENIKSSDEIENAFQALAEGKTYITKEDMKQVRFPLYPFSYALLIMILIISKTTTFSPTTFFRYYLSLYIICFDDYFMLWSKPKVNL